MTIDGTFYTDTTLSVTNGIESLARVKEIRE
jgi:hypothetical protein